MEYDENRIQLNLGELKAGVYYTLIEIDNDKNYIQLKGYIGNLNLVKKRPSDQYLFIKHKNLNILPNRRKCRDKCDNTPIHI